MKPAANRGRRRSARPPILLGLVLTLALLVGPSLVAPSGSTLPSATAAATAKTATQHYPKRGQHGSAVRSLQRKLVEADLLRAQYRTGYFGAKTTAAVRAVQRRAGLTVTGRVNAATVRALDRAARSRQGRPTWTRRISIGTSQSGRKIYAYRAGEPGKPVVVVTATMHGEEDFGQYVARGLIQGRQVRGVDLWVLPVLNPDGLARDRRWLNGGVDLNRNFPNRWITRANTGPRAASAKETRLVMAFLRRTRPRYLVSWHQPLYGTDSYRVKDRALMQRLSKGLHIPVRKLDCHGSCHGTMTGWYNENFAGTAITVEYGTRARSMKRMLTTDADAVLRAVGGGRA